MAINVIIGDVFDSPESDYPRTVRVVGFEQNDGRWLCLNVENGRHTRMKSSTLARWTRIVAEGEKADAR